MDKSNVVEFAGRDGIVDPMTELLRTGTEQLIYQAVEGELQELLARHTERRLCDGGLEWFVMAICRRASFRRD